MQAGSPDYIPLAQAPFTQPRAAGRASAATMYCLRRRLVLWSLFGTSLLTLFVYMKHSFNYIDVELDDLDIDLFPPQATSSLQTESYLPFQVVSRPNDTAHLPLRPVPPLPSTCLDAYFARGDACYASQPAKLDLLWTWVNGSDPLEQQAKTNVAAKFDSQDPWRPSMQPNQARLYRDHDELRHSLRSILANFRSHIGSFLLLTSDFPIPETTPNLTLPGAWRLGQIPQWLDLSKQTRSGWRDSDVALKILHHAEIFQPYEDTIFNSLAIESQLGHVPGISDHFIYMNDDLYFGQPTSSATFYSSAYGIVLHLQADLMVGPGRPNPRTQGEWRGMGESNYMLSARFGQRHRPYVYHEAKVVSVAILNELETVWPEAFARSASHPFRETMGPGAPSDINTMLLHAHYIVERAREALLWSWVVARIGPTDDLWGENQARRAWEELGGVWEGTEGERAIEVVSGRRNTLEKERIEYTLVKSGIKDGLGKTSYVFTSLDGYAYATLGTGGGHFPSFLPDEQERALPKCTINYARCFAGHSRASDVFKHIAFDNYRCGDCVISALVRASGPLGIAAFLPPPDRMLSSLAGKVPTPADVHDVPHLPLVDKWEDGDFSLREVMGTAGERNVRTWTIQLLQRYRYVMGSTPAVFERLQTAKQTAAMLSHLERFEDAVLMCINDDVITGEQEVARMFRQFQEKHWGHPAAWEKR
ncbi:hypothetical protein WOLCODRAFT_136778 [Wolfiporia cocos MD-104 SS10]|uniref:Stealth protein CR3 conserved region 3 domain-containing protein n=1 Tax=Wolfiporia cocos (strain MD-104) TaxID=742152 RepID=A0A2H3JNE7_WOLCO|nr:hypothetical protein WOLCODRAFT_136778 [Wolfiporia cocos MD-104 SS10]